MVKNPYIGMPIEITDWEDTPCEGCSTGGSAAITALTPEIPEEAREMTTTGRMTVLLTACT